MENINTEKIIEKIKKILELSKNNPSQEEAKAAALKAHKLMAEYHISMKEIETDKPEEMKENTVEVGNGNKWKYSLANIISNNFRCKYFLYGNSRIVFYGFQTDVEIASMTFQYLFETGNKAANNYYQKMRNDHIKKYGLFDGKGIKNCFLVGFVEGIKSVLEKQSTELMIVTPKEVENGFKERTSGSEFRSFCPKLNARSRYASESHSAGLRAGKNAVREKRLEASA